MVQSGHHNVLKLRHYMYGDQLNITFNSYESFDQNMITRRIIIHNLSSVKNRGRLYIGTSPTGPFCLSKKQKRQMSCYDVLHIV